MTGSYVKYKGVPFIVTKVNGNGDRKAILKLASI